MTPEVREAAHGAAFMKAATAPTLNRQEASAVAYVLFHTNVLDLAVDAALDVVEEREDA